jgi:hypothetical protein
MALQRTAWLTASPWESLDSWSLSPDPAIVVSVLQYPSDPVSVIFSVCEDGSDKVCRSRGGFAGELQLTFYRSFSYSHYKSLLRHSRPCNSPHLGGKTFRRARTLKVKTDRASCFIFRIAVFLGHILVFGVRGRSRLRLIRVTQYLIAAALYYAHPNNPVETLRDHDLNTRE